MKLAKMGIFISLLIMQVFFVTGCTQKEEVTMGRYIEQDVALEAMDSYEVLLMINSEGKKQIFTEAREDMQCFTLQEDMSFQEEKPQWLELLKEKDKERHYTVRAITLDTQDQPYLLVTAERIIGAKPNDAYDNMRTFILSFTPEGIKETMLQLENTIPMLQTEHFIVLDNGTCVIGSDGMKVAAYGRKYDITGLTK